MPEVSHTSERLAALRADVAAKFRSSRPERDQAIRELAALINELDPIPRKIYWPTWLLREMVRAQRGFCPSCRERLPSIDDRTTHVDHVIPWSLGGGNEPRNLRVLHADCNLAKGRRCDIDDLIEYLRGRVFNL